MLVGTGETLASSQDEQTRALFRDIALHRAGDYHRSALGRFAQRRVRERVLEDLDEALADRAAPRIIDAGCGRGDLSVRLLERYTGAEILAIDASPEMANLATIALRPWSNSRAEVAELTAIPAPDRWATATVCINVLHHLEPPQQRRALRELARVTERTLVVEVKLRQSFRSRQTEGVRVHPTTVRAVVDALAPLGFRLLRESGALRPRWVSPVRILRFEMHRAAI
jgi:SAM-dependent methyltransferase